MKTIQKYTSANTSINTNKPAIYGLVDVTKTGATIDYGCGKYFDRYNLPDNVVGYDPYNYVNEDALKRHYDTALLSNVLNVIAEKEVRHEILETLASLADTVYITIYDGNRTGEGRPTMEDCYQLNKKVKEYLPEIQEVFSNVTLKHGMFTCTDPYLPF